MPVQTTYTYMPCTSQFGWIHDAGGIWLSLEQVVTITAGVTRSQEIALANKTLPLYTAVIYISLAVAGLPTDS